MILSLKGSLFCMKRIFVFCSFFSPFFLALNSAGEFSFYSGRVCTFAPVSVVYFLIAIWCCLFSFLGWVIYFLNVWGWKKSFFSFSECIFDILCHWNVIIPILLLFYYFIFWLISPKMQYLNVF